MQCCTEIRIYSTPRVEYPALPLHSENIDFHRRVAQDVSRRFTGCARFGWLFLNCVAEGAEHFAHLAVSPFDQGHAHAPPAPFAAAAAAAAAPTPATSTSTCISQTEGQRLAWQQAARLRTHEIRQGGSNEPLCLLLQLTNCPDL